MARLYALLFIFSSAFSAHAAENIWSYEYSFKSANRGRLSYSATVKSGYNWFRLHPQKDGKFAYVNFGYYSKKLPQPKWFKIILTNSNGSKTTVSGTVTKSMYSSVGMFNDSTEILLKIHGKDLRTYQSATSLKVVLSNFTMNFPMRNSKAAIGKAVSNASIGYEVLVENCNGMSALRWDRNTKRAGVSWEDLDASAAIGYCVEAYNLDTTNFRIAYQTGRIYDKMKSPSALEFLKYAADNGYTPAAYHYSLLMNDGVYVSKNHTKYLKYLMLASGHGFAPADATYGQFLIDQSNPSSKDVEHGRALLVVAAQKGYDSAGYYLGRKYMGNTFGPRNVKLAVEYFTQAAWGGHGSAMYYLAIMLRDGNGVPQDLVGYRKLLKRAADSGHEKAKKELTQ